MNKKIDVIELKDKTAEDFRVLKDMSLDLNNYFNEFYENNCNVSDDKKKEKMIKEDYWIDILQGIQEDNSKYVEYSFTYISE